MKRGIIIFIFLMCLAYSASANNLTISNVSIEDRDAVLDTAIVEFDLSWDNSWRNTTNYDAVWIVLKVQTGGVWYQGMLKNGGVDPAGTSPGSNKDLEVYVPTDTHGVTDYYFGAFIYRKSSGTGTVTSKDVRLKLDYSTTGTFSTGAAFADTASIIVKVVGVEMVYIPQESFYAGDNAGSTAAFKRGSSSDNNPWYIDSESTIRVNNATTGTFYYTSASNASEFASGTQFTIPSTYPKGYAAFYCMKYEVTEGGWLDFFNTLSASEKSTRDITSATGKNADTVVKRNTIAYTSGSATTTRGDRVINYISWMDLAAYLDWMALRPMTEMEYEKAARGGLSAVSTEYAWGNTNITAGVTFSGSPEDGNETLTTANANANCNITTFSQGDDFLGAQYVQGAVRGGIFATSSSTRSTSGAGYYGVMELSGNLFERTVTVGNTIGISYFPWHGDGRLSTTTVGNARQIGWPGSAYYTGYIGVSGADGSGYNGGAWDRACTGGTLAVSNRSLAALIATSRDYYGGGRGVRSVSPVTLPRCGDSTTTPPETCDDGGTSPGDGCSEQCETETTPPSPGVN